MSSLSPFSLLCFILACDNQSNEMPLLPALNQKMKHREQHTRIPINVLDEGCVFKMSSLCKHHLPSLQLRDERCPPLSLIVFECVHVSVWVSVRTFVYACVGECVYLFRYASVCVSFCASACAQVCVYNVRVGGMIFVAVYFSKRAGRNKSTNFQRCLTFEVKRFFLSIFRQEVLMGHNHLALKCFCMGIFKHWTVTFHLAH